MAAAFSRCAKEKNTTRASGCICGTLATGQAFTRDQRFKLCQTGKFYDVSKGPLEKSSLGPKGKGTAVLAHEKLAKGLLPDTTAHA